MSSQSEPPVRDPPETVLLVSKFRVCVLPPPVLPGPPQSAPRSPARCPGSAPGTACVPLRARRVALPLPEPCGIWPLPHHCLLFPRCALPVTIRAPVSPVACLHLSSPYTFMATHSGTPAWRTPWTEEPSGLQSTGGKESDTTERLLLVPFHCPVSPSITSPSHLSPSLMHFSGPVNGHHCGVLHTAPPSALCLYSLTPCIDHRLLLSAPTSLLMPWSITTSSSSHFHVLPACHSTLAPFCPCTPLPCP